MSKNNNNKHNQGLKVETKWSLDSEELLKGPRSNRDAQQPNSTSVKLEPFEWNNVPTVVYETVIKLIQQIDAIRKREEGNKSDMKRQLDETKNYMKLTQDNLQEVNSIFKTTLVTEQTRLAQRMSENTQDLNGYVSKIESEVDRLVEDVPDIKQTVQDMVLDSNHRKRMVDKELNDDKLSIEKLKALVYSNHTYYETKLEMAHLNFDVQNIYMGVPSKYVGKAEDEPDKRSKTTRRSVQISAPVKTSGPPQPKTKTTILRDAFNSVDKNKNGLINKAELETLLQALPSDQKDNLISELMRHGDVDHDGNLHFNEWANAVETVMDDHSVDLIKILDDPNNQLNAQHIEQLVSEPYRTQDDCKNGHAQAGKGTQRGVGVNTPLPFGGSFVEFMRYMSHEPFDLIEKLREEHKSLIMDTSREHMSETQQKYSNLESKLEALTARVQGLDGNTKARLESLTEDIYEEMAITKKDRNKQAALHKEIDESMAALNNDLKNQNLKFAKMIDHLNGERDALEEQLKKMIEENTKINNTYHRSALIKPESSRPKPISRKSNEKLSQIQKSEVENMIEQALGESATTPNTQIFLNKRESKITTTENYQTLGISSRGSASPDQPLKPPPTGPAEGQLLEEAGSEPSTPPRTSGNPDLELHYRATRRFKKSEQAQLLEHFGSQLKKKIKEKIKNKNLTMLGDHVNENGTKHEIENIRRRKAMNLRQKNQEKQWSQKNKERHDHEQNNSMNDDYRGSGRSNYQHNSSRTAYDPSTGECANTKDDQSHGYGKRVRVDRFTNEFSDEDETRTEMYGEVRRFVHDLNSKQKAITASNFKVRGHKTGSNFYPNRHVSGGIQTKYSQVSTTNALSRPYQTISETKSRPNHHLSTEEDFQQGEFDISTQSHKPHIQMPIIRNTSAAGNEIDPSLKAHAGRTASRLSRLDFGGQPLAVNFEDMALAKQKMKLQLRNRTPGGDY